MDLVPVLLPGSLLLRPSYRLTHFGYSPIGKLNEVNYFDCSLRDSNG